MPSGLVNTFLQKTDVFLSCPRKRTAGIACGPLGKSLNTYRPRGIGVNIGEKVEKSRYIKQVLQLYHKLLYVALRILTAKNGKFYRKLEVDSK